MTQPVKSGDTITVNYTGKFESGEVFDSSEGREPLKFTVGAGQLIKGFDTAVIGMVPGDKKEVTIPPEEGYGPKNDEMTAELPKSAIPPEMDIQVGMQVQLMNQNGQPVPATAIEIQEESIKFDLNHPLAGKTLIFSIEVVETGLEPDPMPAGCGCDCSSSGGCNPEDGNCGC